MKAHSLPVAMLSGKHLTYRRKVLKTGPVAYWPLDDTSGTTCLSAVNPAQNGTYDTGVALGRDGIGDGLTSIFCDQGDQCGTRIESDALEAVFNPAVGSMMVWIASNSPEDWTDGSPKVMIGVLGDPNNHIAIKKNYQTHELFIGHTGNNLTRLAKLTNPNTTDWICVVGTWDVAANQLKLYTNGVYRSANAQALSAWNSTPGLIDYAAFGGEPTTPVGTWFETWHGKLAHAAIWNRVLSAAEAAYLAGVAR